MASRWMAVTSPSMKLVPVLKAAAEGAAADGDMAEVVVVVTAAEAVAAVVEIVADTVVAAEADAAAVVEIAAVAGNAAIASKFNRIVLFRNESRPGRTHFFCAVR